MNAALPLFALDNANLHYQDKVVIQHASLCIRSGERVALIGKSGSGKTTLLRTLREQLPDAVAWCPQNPGLTPQLSVFHNIYIGALPRHTFLYNLLNLCKPLPKASAAVLEIARKVQLEDQLYTSVDQLSGGQQQRTNIGRALMQQRPAFFGDEPVSSVDDYQAQALLNTIVQQHKTVVLALHDIPTALKTCSRVVGIKDGRIVLDKQSGTLSADELADIYR